MSQFDDIQRRIQDRINRQLQGATAALGTRVIQGTPVRDGFARANWNFAVGAPDTTNQDKGNQSEAELVASVPDFRVGMVAYFINSLPYIRRLEYGWSDQAPKGMLRLNVAEWGDINREVARNL